MLCMSAPLVALCEVSFTTLLKLETGVTLMDVAVRQLLLL